MNLNDIVPPHPKKKVYIYYDNIIIVNSFRHDIIFWKSDTMTALQWTNQNDMEEGQAFSVYWASATMLVS